MELATYLEKHKWIFNITCEHADLRLCDKRMETIKSWKDFPSGKGFNEIALYIMFMYQLDSPLVKKFPELNKRREEAIKESGLHGEMAECLKTMTIDSEVEGKSNPLKKVFTKAIDMIMGFLMYQGDIEWASICIYESLFVEYSATLLTGISNVKNDKDRVAAVNAKKVTMEEYMKVKDALKEAKNRFYNGDSDLQDVVEKKNKFNPESISKML